ncbi:solute carrier family 23 member 1-like [Saccostrea echinata]|uniref:solute carrier family 23 member 1-like n=1 Tax=Saccostrea echinata TaxID=191078 RepID=UPI002A7ECFE3|nr:solute carrier family 23 member 1-like [Saccostrea echinata]
MDKATESSNSVITSTHSNNDDFQENRFTTPFVEPSIGNISSRNISENVHPQTPPSSYTLASTNDFEEDAPLLDLKKEENMHNDAEESSTLKGNFDSCVQMEQSEKVHMLLGESYSNAKNVDSDIIDQERQRLIYKVSQRPPLSLLLFFGLQQCLIVLPSIVKATMLVAEVMCARDEEEFKVQLMSMSLLMSGMCTFLQNSIGFRVPVYQGPVSMYILPLLAILNLPQYACPDRSSFYNQTSDNSTDFYGEEMRATYFQAVVIPKFLKISGALILAGFLHMLIGLTGTVGFVLRFIGPITVIPTILLMGINTYSVVYMFCSTHWGVSLLTASIAILLSMYLDRYNMPIPVWTRDKGFYIIRYPLHQVFSVLIAGAVGWITSAILTSIGVFSDDPKNPEFYARTDSKIAVVEKIPWLVFPYPGMYGTPGFDVGVFAAFIIATITSIIDSIADYYAVSRVVRVPSPPVHAINRGILTEGFMSMMAGVWGASHATSTYGSTIGFIALTKVASRNVFQLLGVLLMILGVLGKVSSVFVTIPYPVVGGLQVVAYGFFIGLVFGNLQYIDMNSTRNLAIIGISMLWGLVIPYWSKLKGEDVINTGSVDADNLLKMLTRNPNFTGFLIALILDNTVPGTLKERGMTVWQAADQEDEGEDQSNNLEEGREAYDIPALSKFFRKYRITAYIPFLPTYSPKNSKKSK